MKEDKEFDPVMELAAGCPFINFEKCQGGKCIFFVKTFSNDPDDARDCIFRSSYLLQLTSSLALELASVSDILNNKQLSPRQIFATRFVESIGDSFRKLDGLLAHPKTSDSLKATIRELKLKLLEQVKIFGKT